MIAEKRSISLICSSLRPCFCSSRVACSWLVLARASSYSADSPRLIEAIDRISGELALCVPILLEVNVSGEEAKHGFEPDAVVAADLGLARYRYPEIEREQQEMGLDSDPNSAMEGTPR